MANIKGNALSAKGVLLKQAKDLIKAHDIESIESALAEAEFFGAKKEGVFIKTYNDSAGNEFYGILECPGICTPFPFDNASVKTSKPKKASAPIEIVFEDEGEDEGEGEEA